MHEKATRRIGPAAVILAAAALVIVAVIAAMLLRRSSGPTAPTGPGRPDRAAIDPTGPDGTPGPAADRIPGPRLIVRFDRDTYTIHQDTEIQITIEGVEDAPPDFVLTNKMLARTDLNWLRYELKE